MVNTETIENIIKEFGNKVEEKVAELKEELKKKLDLNKIEEAIENIVKNLVARILGEMINGVLKEEETEQRLRELGGRKGLHLKEYRAVKVRLGNGENINVRSPYFIKAAGKRGRKKRGPNGRGSHLGLEVMGIMGRCSMKLVSEVVEMAVLCPSFEIAETVLKRRGIKIDLKTIRRLCSELGEQGIKYRGQISLDGSEDLRGQTLVIGIDGGRLRERTNKRGRKKAGQKRQGFYSDWKEPKLFTIYLEDQEGEIIREFAPLHDATMGDHKAMFRLLSQYLQALDLSKVSRLVFCADGADLIWSGIENLFP